MEFGVSACDLLIVGALAWVPFLPLLAYKAVEWWRS